MGFFNEGQSLLRSSESFTAGDGESLSLAFSAPKDRSRAAYAIFFLLGMGFLLPWNAFITAVDYFSYLYPSAPVDRVFSVAYMLSVLLPLFFIIGLALLSSAAVRINVGFAFFTTALLIAPALDFFYVRSSRGVYGAFDVTVAAVCLAGLGDALVQGGVIGSAGELPEIYMQAVFSGTAASGVLVSAMRIICKAIFPQDAAGLRNSANLYFAVAIFVMIICIISFNMSNRLPVVQYYKNLKTQAMNEERKARFLLTGSVWRATLWSIFVRIKWHGFGIFLIYAVTLSVFPGYITEDVHSEALKDWYPIILISGYNIFDLVGKALPAVFPFENEGAAVGYCAARLLFYPLFFGCIHGPRILRTEMPVVILTCLLGLTNGYLTTVIMSLAPKSVPIQHSETAGIVMLLFLATGLAVGSMVSWLWMI